MFWATRAVQHSFRLHDLSHCGFEYMGGALGMWTVGCAGARGAICMTGAALEAKGFAKLNGFLLWARCARTTAESLIARW